MSGSLLLSDTALEDEAGLQAALAFLDELEESPLPPVSGPSIAHGAVDVTVSVPPTQPKRSRRRDREAEAEADVARRRRKKDERLALSHEAHVLALRLALLRDAKTRRGSPARVAGVDDTTVSALEGTMSGWYQRALNEAHQSTASLERNKKLKDALKRQHALLTAMRDALARAQPKESPSTRQLSLNNQPGRNRSLLLALKCSMRQQYDDLESAIAPATSSTDMVTSSFAFKMDPVRGPYAEHTTMTVVPNELGVVAALVEDSLIQLSPPCADLEFIVQTTPSDECLGFEKQYSVELHSPGMTVPMSGAGFIRIYREPDRVVLLWTNQLLHSNGLRFHERRWFIAARLPAHPSTKSLVRSCYRLEVEKPRRRRLSQQDEGVSNFVQSKLVARMRSKFEAVQYKLLEQVGGEAATTLSSYFDPHGATCSPT